MRVAVKSSLAPACGGSGPLPKGLSRANRLSSSDLVPSRAASARCVTGRESGQPYRRSEIAVRATAPAWRNVHDRARELSPRPGMVPFILSRRLSATPPVRGELHN